MELVRSECRTCESAELLPLVCESCCYVYCKEHAVTHECPNVVDLLAEQHQDVQAVGLLANLFLNKILPEIVKSNTVRRLNRNSPSFKCLDHVRGGTRFLASLGWRTVGDDEGYLELDTRAIVLSKALAKQQREFQVASLVF
jgi:hypothetical protein